MSLFQTGNFRINRRRHFAEKASTLLVVACGAVFAIDSSAACRDLSLVARFVSVTPKPGICLDWQGGLQSRFKTKTGRTVMTLWDYSKSQDLDRLLVSPHPKMDVRDYNCLMRLLSGDSTCADVAFVPEDTVKFKKNLPRDWDALAFGREALKHRGAVTARAELIQVLRAQDDSRGEFEANVERGMSDSHFSIRDSIGDLSLDRKGRIFVGLANGYVNDQSKVGSALGEFKAKLDRDGFHAEILPTKTYDDTTTNARRIADRLNKISDDFDAIILMGVSKGISEITQTVNNRRMLTDSTLAKLRLVISMAGVIRYSVAARWIINHNDRVGSLLMHQILNWNLGDDYWQGLVGLATDSWPRPTKNIRSPDEFSRLHWLSISALPSEATGLPQPMPHMGWVQTQVLKDSASTIGPFDEVIESGASVLPRNTGITQWILPVLATHFVLEGTFLDGRPVSSVFRANPKLKLSERFSKGALQLQDAILRSVPAEVVNP